MSVAPPPVRRLPPPLPGTPATLTAEQFIRLPDTRGRDLFRGRVIEIPMPGSLHGAVCNETAFTLTAFVKEYGLGRVLTNDSHLQVPTEDGTDTVRGMDAAFFSWERMPRGPVPVGLPPNPPEFIVEVRSPSDRPGEINRKIWEYLARGVDEIVTLNPARRTASVYTRDEDEPVPLREDELLVPGPFLPGFSVRVGDLFDV